MTISGNGGMSTGGSSRTLGVGVGTCSGVGSLDFRVTATSSKTGSGDFGVKLCNNDYQKYIHFNMYKYVAYCWWQWLFNMHNKMNVVETLFS